MRKLGISILGSISMILLTLFSGCGIYDKMDLETVHQELINLKSSVLDLSKLKGASNDLVAYFGELEDIEINRLDDLKINKDYIAMENNKVSLVFKQEKRNDVNTTPLTSYIIVKPAEDKKDLLKKQIDKYYQNIAEEYNQKSDAKEEIKDHLKNVMKKEYEGYLVYILSYDNEAVWNFMKQNSHPILFENVKEISLEEISQRFSLNEKNIDEYQAAIPKTENSSSFYIIIKPKKGKADNIKKELEQYMNQLEQKWSTYLPEEYELVKNRMETEIGSYLIYIISRDNELVLNTIKNTIVKKDK